MCKARDMTISPQRARQVLPELETAQANVAELEKMNTEFQNIAASLSDALVSTLSLLAAGSHDARSLGFVGDAVEHVRTAFSALERASNAHTQLIVNEQERINELTTEFSVKVSED